MERLAAGKGAREGKLEREVNGIDEDCREEGKMN